MVRLDGKRGLFCAGRETPPYAPLVGSSSLQRMVRRYLVPFLQSSEKRLLDDGWNQLLDGVHASLADCKHQPLAEWFLAGQRIGNGVEGGEPSFRESESAPFAADNATLIVEIVLVDEPTDGLELYLVASLSGLRGITVSLGVVRPAKRHWER